MKRDDILQKRPVILRSLLIVATPHLYIWKIRHTRCLATSVSDEPYISAKEPYISAKEPYIAAKEPYISATKPYISEKDLVSESWHMYVMTRSQGVMTHPRDTQCTLSYGTSLSHMCVCVTHVWHDSPMRRHDSIRKTLRTLSGYTCLSRVWHDSHDITTHPRNKQHTLSVVWHVSLTRVTWLTHSSTPNSAFCPL